jgi:hypothetical protein
MVVLTQFGVLLRICVEILQREKKSCNNLRPSRTYLRTNSYFIVRLTALKGSKPLSKIISTFPCFFRIKMTTDKNNPTDPKKPEKTRFHVIRKSETLSGSAIFWSHADFISHVDPQKSSQDSSIEYASFDTIEEAIAYVNDSENDNNNSNASPVDLSTPKAPPAVLDVPTPVSTVATADLATTTAASSAEATTTATTTPVATTMTLPSLTTAASAATTVQAPSMMPALSSVATITATTTPVHVATTMTQLPSLFTTAASAAATMYAPSMLPPSLPAATAQLQQLYATNAAISAAVTASWLQTLPNMTDHARPYVPILPLLGPTFPPAAVGVATKNTAASTAAANETTIVAPTGTTTTKTLFSSLDAAIDTVETPMDPAAAAAVAAAAEAALAGRTKRPYTKKKEKKSTTTSTTTTTTTRQPSSSVKKKKSRSQGFVQRYLHYFKLLKKFHSQFNHVKVPPVTKNSAPEMQEYQGLHPWLKQMRKHMSCFENDREKSVLKEAEYQELKELGIDKEWWTGKKNRSRGFDQRYLYYFKLLKKFQSQFNHVKVPLVTERSAPKMQEYQGLHSWLKQMRKHMASFENDQENSVLKETEYQELKELGIDKEWWIGKEEKFAQEEAIFDDMVEQLRAFKEEYGHTFVPQRPRTPLYNWITRMRVAYADLKAGKKSFLDKPERIAKIQAIGFSLTATVTRQKFDERAVEWLEYKTEHGTPNPPKTSRIGKWCHKMRRRYHDANAGRPSHMTPEQMRKLTDWGFDWGDPEYYNNPIYIPTKSFDERFKQLEEYCKEHGDLLVPQKYPGTKIERIIAADCGRIQLSFTNLR